MHSRAPYEPDPEILADLPFPALILTPPYQRTERVPHLSGLKPERLFAGSLLALELTHPSASWEQLQKWIPSVRRSFTNAPVLLWIPGATTVGEMVHLARRVGKIGVRAVLTADEPIQLTLRPIMTNPVRLEADVVEWLSLRGVNISPDISYLIQQIFRLAPEHRTLSDVLAPLHIPASSAGAKFSKKLLPPPSIWLHAAHALHAALRLQRDPNVSVLRVALEYGYSDHSALSRQMVRNFGLRPSQIRGTLGWEWLLDRWVRRITASSRGRRAAS